MKSSETILALRAIAAKHNNVLKPEDVVEAARPKTSPLHDRFTWDDNVAAEQYRLWEARQLIRTTIQYIEIGGEEKRCRVFCSLTPDRTEEGGGYRETTAVLSNKKYRAQLLADAYAEMKFFAAKYDRLQELAGVIREINKVVEPKRVMLQRARQKSAA
jgi:hypothetical protein